MDVCYFNQPYTVYIQKDIYVKRKIVSDLDGSSRNLVAWRSWGDSGAIMVGAGDDTTAHNKIDFSNFGSRVDVQAWGMNVYSAGMLYVLSLILMFWFWQLMAMPTQFGVEEMITITPILRVFQVFLLCEFHQLFLKIVFFTGTSSAGALTAGICLCF